MPHRTVRPLMMLAACVLVSTCAAPAPRTRVSFSQGGDLSALGLAPCDPSQRELLLAPNRPLTLLVHGCNASGGRFRILSQVFKAHDQQTVCFNYNDRDSMEVSAGQLRKAIASLLERQGRSDLDILGHSQGGLVARRALVREGNTSPVYPQEAAIRLVTVSSPFDGIEASADCGSLGYHVLTLGISAAICQIAAGSKWNEIHPRAAFIRAPGLLAEPVSIHILVQTDELGTCLRRDGQGRCVQGDFVFSLEEQHNASIEADMRVASRKLAAGHSEVVGQDGAAPWKLIRLLQAEKILNETPPKKQEAIARWIDALFADHTTKSKKVEYVFGVNEPGFYVIALHVDADNDLKKDTAGDLRGYVRGTAAAPVTDRETATPVEVNAKSSQIKGVRFGVGRPTPPSGGATK